eukprot:TRINITY_DN272_c0_g1_i7.p1 TRINITY_DN272_c0_g1~~TRINITY_DN272_c0_g1_i7.p1  ORF type:complete len:391 (+),score=18.30 TRINITY_DN272_c0_g1_i7:160-1332(+)
MGRSNCTIYVGNLPGDIRESEIEDLFYKYGRIMDIDLKLPRRPPGYCFVEFEDPRDAEDAIRGRDGYKFDGHRLRVEMAYGGRASSVDTYDDYYSRRSYSHSHRPTGYRVIVYGLPSSASWQDLKDHMRHAGDVCFAQVYRKGRGTVGVVDYRTYEDMKYAIKRLDDTEFRNPFSRSYIRVKEDRGYSLSPSRSYSRSPSYDYYRSRRHRYSYARSYTRSRSYDSHNSYSHSYSRSPSITRSRSYSRSPARTHSHSISRSISRSLASSPSRAHSRSFSRSRSRSFSKSPERRHLRSPSASRSRSRSVSRSRSRSVSRSPASSRSCSRSPARMSLSRSLSHSHSRYVSSSPVRRRSSKRKTYSRSISRSPSVSMYRSKHNSSRKGKSRSYY